MNDRYSQVVLTIIALALVALAVDAWFYKRDCTSDEVCIVYIDGQPLQVQTTEFNR